MVWRSRRHLDAFLAAFPGEALAGGRRGSGSSGAAAAGAGAAGAFGLRRGDHIVLGQPAVLAAALDRRRIDMMLQHRAAHCGRQRQRGVIGRARLGRVGRMLVAAQRRSLGGSGRVGHRLGRGRRRGGRSGSTLIDPRDNRPDLDRVALGEQLLTKRPRHRRRHFDRDLVGLQADDRLVERDRFARRLQPLADGRLGDRFAQRRDLYVGGHVVSFLNWLARCWR